MLFILGGEFKGMFGSGLFLYYCLRFCFLVVLFSTLLWFLFFFFSFFFRVGLIPLYCIFVQDAVTNSTSPGAFIRMFHTVCRSLKRGRRVELR